MKSVKVLTTLAIALIAVGCSKVPAGNVGVKVYLLGGAKGVDSEELGPGRYYIGINEELYLFPTFTQNYTWTFAPVDEDGDGDIDDSEKIDESIQFQTAEGMNVAADVGISYTVDPTKVTVLFQKFRKGIDEITDGYLRNQVRDALVKAAGNLPIETVYGKGKTELLDTVEKNVRSQVAPVGIIVEKLYWAGTFRLPDAVVTSINSKIKATQMAQQRRNEVEQAKAEAEKAIETSRGVAESRLTVARADAESIRLKGDALRDNPQVLQLRYLEKWNGTLPTTMAGDAGMLIQLPVPTAVGK